MSSQELVIRADGLRLGRGQNDRGYSWRSKWRRTRAERARIFAEVARVTKGMPRRLPALVGPAPYAVTLVRVGPSQGLDTDNLAGSLKAVRDEVARCLGVDDGLEAPVTWTYSQRRGPWGVEIWIKPSP